MVDKKTIANMSIRIGADSSMLRKNMKNARRELGFFDKQAMSLKNTLGSLFAVSAGIAYFDKIIKSYQTQAEASSRLETIMRTVNNATDAQINKLKELADQQAKLTTIGDEVTEMGYSQLASFSLNTEQIKKLSKGFGDLLVATYGTKVTTEQAIQGANLIGKAYTGLVGALTRVGVLLTEDQKKLIKEGDAMTRVNTLAKVLEQNYGGVAEAQAKIKTGPWLQLKNRIADNNEKLGEFIITSKAATQALSDLNLLLDTISNISLNLKTNSDSLIKTLWEETKRYNVLNQSLNLTRWQLKEINKILEKRGKFKMETETEKAALEYRKKRQKEQEKETKAIIQQIPILDQFQDKIKEIQAARDASLTEKDWAKYNKELNYYQEKLKKLNELGITKKAPEKPTVQMEKVDYEEELDPLWNFDEWDTMQAQWDAYLEDLNRRLTEWRENYAIEQQKIQAINNAIETSMEEMVGSVAGSLGELGATGKTNFASALLTPMADMAEQLGKLAIAEGLTIEAIKKSFSTLSGIGAIALGGALILVAKAVKSSVAAIGQGATASLNTSGPASYTNANASGPGIETITRNFGENNQLMRVEVFGKLSNNDIVFANKRGSEKLERIAG